VIKKSFPHLISCVPQIVPTYGTDYRKPENASRFTELAATARKQLKLI
jgi:malate dehydrogenase (quinone)